MKGTNNKDSQNLVEYVWHIPKAHLLPTLDLALHLASLWALNRQPKSRNISILIRLQTGQKTHKEDPSDLILNDLLNFLSFLISLKNSNRSCNSGNKQIGNENCYTINISICDDLATFHIYLRVQT